MAEKLKMEVETGIDLDATDRLLSDLRFVRGHLRLVDRIWHLDFSDTPVAGEVQALFGTRVLPTPFLTGTNKEDVVTRIVVGARERLDGRGR